MNQIVAVTATAMILSFAAAGTTTAVFADGHTSNGGHPDFQAIKAKIVTKLCSISAFAAHHATLLSDR
jgi:hypothetical protein